MKFYNLDTEFTFGIFEGKSLLEILELELSYVEWCAINLDHFFISESVIEEIKAIKPEFELSDEGKQELNTKYATYEKNVAERSNSERHSSSKEYFEDPWSDWEKENELTMTDNYNQPERYDDY